MEQFSFSGMLNWSINVTFSIFTLAQTWQGIYGKLRHHLLLADVDCSCHYFKTEKKLQLQETEVTPFSIQIKIHSWLPLWCCWLFFSYVVYIIYSESFCCCCGNFLGVKKAGDKIFSFMSLTKGCNVLMYVSLTPWTSDGKY